MTDPQKIAHTAAALAQARAAQRLLSDALANIAPVLDDRAHDVYTAVKRAYQDTQVATVKLALIERWLVPPEPQTPQM